MDVSPEVVESYWKAGKTLPLEASEHLPQEAQPVENDTGVNVLVDLAHQCNFTTLWKFSDVLNQNGYRYISTHACLDTVLTPGQPSRVRTVCGEAEDGRKIRPFVMWPNCEYNVLLTLQCNRSAQAYLDEELEAIDAFVAGGGGLVIVSGMPGSYRNTESADFDTWPLRTLLQRYGADVSTYVETVAGSDMLALSADGWEIVEEGDTGAPVVCRKACGAGNVTLLASTTLLMQAVHHDRAQSDAEEETRTRRFLDMLSWASRGKDPVGGDTRLPSTFGGGGSIYPELETHIGKFAIYYARNQKPEVLALVNREYPKVRDLICQWLPSPEPTEPMFIILGSGLGGGWAVNAFLPKENGIVAYDDEGLIGIFAHELAHTLSGPVNARGDAAANWFDGNQGEAHAGYLQGRIWALYFPETYASLRHCNEIFDQESTDGPIDIATARGGKVWPKLWYIWSRLDEVYGTTWYARWRWVQYTRWQDDPGRALTVDEMVEDMSIAVGADLFPFISKTGATLGRDRFADAEFNGDRIALPVADIAYVPVGPAVLDPIEDFRRPLNG